MIKIKDFKDGNFRRVFVDRKEHPIAKLLRINKGYAYKVDEIAKKTKINKNTIRSMLAKLVKDKLVVHKAPYFVWK